MSQAYNAGEDIHHYLDRHQKKELLHFLTCGSVDDGKSTLIGRLLHDTKMIYEDQLAAVKKDSLKHGTTGEGVIDLALLTDGLRAEREQGITIDVAYRYFSTDKRKFIIADTPGHEQYTRNMATGASTCELAIILIDARHGVMTQTKRHTFICSLLGIKHLVVAINKMDLMNFSQDVFEKIRADYTTFIAKLAEAGWPTTSDIVFIPMSALDGDNVVDPSPKTAWYKGGPLLDHLETVHIAGDRNLEDLRLPVQIVLRPNLNFRGFAGTIASGVLKKGDRIAALPSGQRSTVKAIVTTAGEIDEAFAPMAVTITLADEIDVSRGDMIVHASPAAEDRQPLVTHEFDAMVVWMNEKPLAAGKTYTIKQTTKMVGGELTVRYGVDVNTVEKRPAAALALNEVGRCTLSLNQPIVYDPYTRNAATGGFIIIDRVSNNTVGAGMIMEREPKRSGDHWADQADTHLNAQHGEITTAQKAARLGQKPVTILLTGLTGVGKASVAYALEKKLFDAGRHVSVLYGQNMRLGISRDLGFSADERSENLRRAAEIARIINDTGLICIAAFVAPHEAVREKARQVIGPDRFIEIHLTAPAEFRKKKDAKGVYKLAEAGKLKSFPGVSASYEPPAKADMTLETDKVSVPDCVEKIIALLKSRGYIA